MTVVGIHGDDDVLFIGQLAGALEAVTDRRTKALVGAVRDHRDGKFGFELAQDLRRIVAASIIYDHVLVSVACPTETIADHLEAAQQRP